MNKSRSTLNAQRSTKRSPWTWVPTLYIAEGLPNVVVMAVAVVMYMQLGMGAGNADTSWVVTSRCRFHFECLILVSGNNVLLLPYGIQQCHA